MIHISLSNERQTSHTPGTAALPVLTTVIVYATLSFLAGALETTTLTPSSHPAHLPQERSASEVKIRADSFPFIVRLLCRDRELTSHQWKQQLLQAAPPASAPGAGGGTHCENQESQAVPPCT